MAAHIPFVNSSKEWGLVQEFYADSEIVRVSLRTAESVSDLASARGKLWLDAEIDALHHLLLTREMADPSTDNAGKPQGWKTDCTNHLRQFTSDLPSVLAAAMSRARKPSAEVRSFVRAALDQCAHFAPAWITVPQVPVTGGADRKRTNRALAAAAGEWEHTDRKRFVLVLPAILTKPKLYELKKDSGRIVKGVRQRCDLARAQAVWVVDASLQDQKGTSTNEHRFSKLVAFHEDLSEALPECTVVAGPYWGMNLVLWARSLAAHPAIGVGGGYQYHISARPTRPPRNRLPVPPLRRWAETGGTELHRWLRKVLLKLQTSDPAYGDLARLRDEYRNLRIREAAKRELARFYKGWLDQLEAAPAAGRAMALFQDLAAAYAFGKGLPDLPEKGVSRKPAVVAKQLMLNCL